MYRIYWALMHCVAVFYLALACCPVSAQNADIDILRNINNQRSSSVDGVMVTLSASAEPVTLAVPAVQLLYGYCLHHKAEVSNGWQTVAGLGITAIISTGLKYGIDRKRPYVVYPTLNSYAKEGTSSFPSGHTAFSFSTATLLSLEYRRWYVVCPAYLWATSVAYSRLYLGEHYPTDVLAGAVIGAGSAWLSVKGNKWLQRRRSAHHAITTE